MHHRRWMLPVLVVALAAVAAGTVAGQTPTPGPAADLVLFSSDAGGSFQLHVMGLDGADVRQVVETPGDAFENALTCDGRIVTVHEQPDTSFHSLWTVDLDGTDLKQVTFGNGDHMPTWRPDGEKIAFSSHRDGVRQIYLIDPDGANEVKVTDGTRDASWPHWSPDAGRWAVQLGAWVGASDIFTLAPDGSDVRPVTDTGDAKEPRWGPGGRQIVFARRTTGGDSDIWVVDVATGATRPVVTGPSYDHQPTWLPDGSRIIFTRGREQSVGADIWSVRPDGSDALNLTNTPGAREMWPATACLSPEAPTPTPPPTATPGPVFLPLALRERCTPERRPVDVVLVLDASTSMDEVALGGGTKLDAARDAVYGFLDALSPARDQVALVTFNATARLAQPLTADRGALERALAGIALDRQTRIDLGVQRGAEELLSPRVRPEAMPVLIVLTDGRANPVPPQRAVEAAASAKAVGMTVFTIGVGHDLDRAALRDMASRPDFFYTGASAADLAAIYATIAAELPCPPGEFWGGR